jgi:hypothetical protein
MAGARGRIADAMKLLFDSPDAFLVEMRDRKVEIVRISPALAIGQDRRPAAVPHLVSRVLVTAALDDHHHWAEWVTGLAGRWRRWASAGSTCRRGSGRSRTARWPRCRGAWTRPAS